MRPSNISFFLVRRAENPTSKEVMFYRKNEKIFKRYFPAFYQEITTDGEMMNEEQWGKRFELVCQEIFGSSPIIYENDLNSVMRERINSAKGVVGEKKENKKLSINIELAKSMKTLPDEIINDLAAHFNETENSASDIRQNFNDLFKISERGIKELTLEKTIKMEFYTLIAEGHLEFAIEFVRKISKVGKSSSIDFLDFFFPNAILEKVDPLPARRADLDELRKFVWELIEEKLNNPQNLDKDKINDLFMKSILTHQARENIQCFIEHERSLDIRARSSALSIAMRSGEIDLLNLLLENFKCGNIYFKYDLPMCPLYTAICYAPLEFFIILLEKKIVSPDFFSIKENLSHLADIGLNPLEIVCLRGRLDILRYLIEEEIVTFEQVLRLRIGDKIVGSKCLIYACQSGNPDLVEYLILDGGGKDQCNNKLLFEACMTGNKSIQSRLLFCGLKILDYKHSPLQIAFHNNHSLPDFLIEDLVSPINIQDIIARPIQREFIYTDNHILLLKFLEEKGKTINFNQEVVRAIKYCAEDFLFFTKNEKISESQISMCQKYGLFLIEISFRYISLGDDINSTNWNDYRKELVKIYKDSIVPLCVDDPELLFLCAMVLGQPWEEIVWIIGLLNQEIESEAQRESLYSTYSTNFCKKDPDLYLLLAIVLRKPAEEIKEIIVTHNANPEGSMRYSFSPIQMSDSFNPEANFVIRNHAGGHAYEFVSAESESPVKKLKF